MMILESRGELTPNSSIHVFDIPSYIKTEIDGWVKDTRKWKDHPLGYLKVHENAAYKHPEDGNVYNTYQCSVSPRLVEESLWLPWVLRLANKYFYSVAHHRHLGIIRRSGHFDAYDVWSNFAYKGDSNPSHNHDGFLSGVIYHTNHGHPTYFDDHKVSYEGKDGTMVLFPAETYHHVEEQMDDKERITFAFNIERQMGENRPR